MGFKHYISIILVTLCFATINAQSNKKSAAARANMHKEKLANVKSGMDKNVVADLLKKDVAFREEGNNLSEESLGMLSDLLTEAKKHIGKPYSSGSKGPRAFDCSGFSSYVYRQFGINLSPSSKAQYLQGESVKKNELRQGDLVFFTSRRSGKSVGHVGIVVSADNSSGKFRFIHASSSRGITIDNYAGYYEGRYIGARRIITE